jgi:TATA-binding protein-associated factor Taf7
MFRRGDPRGIIAQPRARGRADASLGAERVKANRAWRRRERADDDDDDDEEGQEEKEEEEEEEADRRLRQERGFRESLAETSSVSYRASLQRRYY